MITVIKESSVYQTAAWGIEDQPSFLNQVVRVDFHRAPARLLELILEIEEEMGRVREEKWGSRLIDIDILYFNNEVVEEKHLSIPHPEIANRRFTILPLLELAPNFVHPTTSLTHDQMLEQTTDKLDAKIFET